MERYIKEHKEDIAEELMDVLYWVLLMAHDLDIDIRGSFERKMVKNSKKYPIEKAKDSHSKYTDY
jgi:NTP pyrophosphatase (non-canonical NTP hydrolase)